MADIIESRNKNPVKTAKCLAFLTATVNEQFKKGILSPLTVTLGDEFQAVLKNRETGINIMLFLEELCIKEMFGFKLRYVLLEGEIETPLNKKIAYGMLGAGLTKTREILNSRKRKEERFFIADEKNQILNDLFILYQSITDDWSMRDYKIIADFIKLDDYKLVAKKNKKQLSLMWKRKRSLKIKEYNILKKLITDEYRME